MVFHVYIAYFKYNNAGNPVQKNRFTLLEKVGICLIFKE